MYTPSKHSTYRRPFCLSTLTVVRYHASPPSRYPPSYVAGLDALKSSSTDQSCGTLTVRQLASSNPAAASAVEEYAVFAVVEIRLNFHELSGTADTSWSAVVTVMPPASSVAMRRSSLEM